MKTKFYLSLGSAALLATAEAGEMFLNIGADVYRDFALNEGIFEAGATDVPIYDKDTGEEIGRIPLVPDFGAVTSTFEGAKGGSLSGGKQSWVTSCSHLGTQSEVRFMEDSTLDASSPYFESYAGVGTQSMLGTSPASDFTVTRLSKVVTDAVGWNYAESTSYSALKNNPIVRVGFGQQVLVDSVGGTGPELEQSTQHLTAGTLDYQSSMSGFRVQASLPDGTTAYYMIDYINYKMTTPSEDNPLPIGARLGDSGSPVLMYDQEKSEWLFIGQLTSVSSSGSSMTMASTYSAEWAEAVQEHYKVRFDNASAGTYVVDRNDNTGMLTFTDDNDNTIEVQALAKGIHGDTRDGNTKATDAQMNATKDWVLSESANIVINSNVDTGAGVLYFNTQDDGTANTYHLSGTEKDMKLNTAGYLIQEDVTVTSTLVGKAGDEWRVVGDTGKGGTLHISHQDVSEENKLDNKADLNIGVGAHVVLDREGYYAANDVKISTQASIQLAQNEAISGSLTIGQDGGTFDLAGHVQTLHEVNSYDEKSLIIGSTGNSQLNIVADKTEFNGSFMDSKSVVLSDGSSIGDGVLNVHYKGTSNDSSIVMSSKSSIAGAFSVEGAQLVLQGEQAELSAASIHIAQDASTKLAGGKLKGDLHLSGTLTIEGNQSLEGVYLNEGHDIVFTNSEDTLTITNLTLSADKAVRFYDQLYLSGEVSVENVSVSLEDVSAPDSGNYSLQRDTQKALTIDTGLSGAHLEDGAALDLLLDEQMMTYMVGLSGSFDSLVIAGLSSDTTNITVSIGMLSSDGSVLRSDDLQGMSFDGSGSGLSIEGKDFGSFVPLPEPSTATMSLLALTGLMMRRRRALS